LALMLFNKPFQVLTRFQTDDGRPVLTDYLSAPGFHPAGRLDHDSEGLLLLTDEGALQAQLSHPKWKVSKSYFAQVENIPQEASVEQLRRGVLLNDGPTLPAEAMTVDEPEWLWPRDPPIRVRKSIPTAWLNLRIQEGRNRQVRRMTAAIGHPTLRLIRWAVGPWSLAGLEPGQWRMATADEMLQFKLMAGRPLTVRRPTKSRFRS